MPVYEYECDVCGTRFDLRRHFGNPHPTVCPAGHEGVHRVFAPPTIIFKGSGFYVTDNGRNGLTSRSSSQDQVSPSKPKEQESKTETTAGEKV
jgi:putative FmdB family regulatory protein